MRRCIKLHKLLSLIVIFFSIIEGLIVIVIFNNEILSDLNRIQESIIFSDPMINKTGKFAIITLEEATSFLVKERKTSLSVFTKVFTFLLGTKINSVDVIFSDLDDQALTKDILPAHKPYPKITDNLIISQ
jgi:hypothetical protein